MSSRLRILVVTCTLTLFAQTSVAQIPQSEIEQRRATILNYADDGIVLLKANASAKEMEQWGWIQNASFYYYSGLGNQPSAILVLDGLKQESHLFVPPAPLSFGVPVQNLSQEPGAESAAALGLDSVTDWGEFESYINKRLRDGVTRLYLEKPRYVESDVT